MRKRSALLVILAATLLALASSTVRGHTTVNYPDVEGCTAGCTVAAAGWPFPYLADYPGLSPAGSASLKQAALGSDHMLWTSFVATWLAWAALVALLAYALRRRRTPQKRRHL
jgi:MYXO-CTERM domain-containing protein